MAVSLSPMAPPLDWPRDRQHRLQRRLLSLNRLRLTPGLPAADDDAATAVAAELEGRQLEEQFVRGERTAVQPLLQALPTEPDQFLAWFDALRFTGPGQGDPLFPWLAEECTLAQMRWFLGQEVAGEAGFDDLVALTQLKMPTTVKLEMARNYWDEMGRGREIAMHGPMLAELSTSLSVALPLEETVWESLALSNLMVALAWNRRYAYHAVGALGVVELTAPGRASYVDAGLRRLGVSARARRYFSVHATLDVKHSAAWNREVLRPLVAANPGVGLAIAEGALMRLRAGARCFGAYRRSSCAPPPVFTEALASASAST